MAKVRFSRRAEADFDDITAYTVRTWNAAQADRYLTLLPVPGRYARARSSVR